LVLALLGITACLVPAPDLTGLDRAISALLAQIPASFGGIWQISYDLLLLWPLVLLVATLVAHGRLPVLRDMSFGLAASIAALAIAAAQVGVDLATVAADGLSADTDGYVGARLTFATALIATASPHLAVPLRRVGRWLVAIGAVASVAIGVAPTVGAILGILLGLAGAAVSHLLFGSPGGRLTLHEVATALADLGVELTDLREEPLDARGVAIVRGNDTAGRRVLVRVFGRDARQGQLIASTWSSLRRRGATPKLGSGWHQVQHEAFVSLFAERAHVPVLPVIAAGIAVEGDALLAVEADATPISALPPDGIEDRTLRDLWAAFLHMDATGIALGRVTPDGLYVRPSGAAALGQFSDAGVAVGRPDLDADKAQLLVVTALAAGRDRAIDAAVSVAGAGVIEDALPYLQHAALDPSVARAVKRAGWDLDDFRVQIEQATGSAPPELEHLRRVTWGSIIKLALIGLISYALISAVSNVGIDNLVEEFRGADEAWLLAALVLSPAVQLPQAVATKGATLRSVPYFPVLMLQYAIAFVALAVPSTAARVALQIRFFERIGVGAASAVAIGMIDGFSLFTVQMLLILVITVSGLASLQLIGSISGSGGPSISWETVLVGLVLLAVAFAVALFIPRLRALLGRFYTGVKQGASDSRQALRVLRSPRKVGSLLGGNLAAQTLLAIILGMCLEAFGHSASLAELLLIQTFVSLFAGFMPVPGGVGVAEAGYTAALIAIGVPEAAAASTALLFRLVTFYIPPAWGVFAMRWMRTNRYL
jgi:uncharacterized membrane protein YbhN (UPF0104 family)